MEGLNRSQTISVRSLPKIEWFKAACMYAQTQIEIRKAQGNCDFKDFEGVAAISKIAMEIGKNID